MQNWKEIFEQENSKNFLRQHFWKYKYPKSTWLYTECFILPLCHMPSSQQPGTSTISRFCVLERGAVCSLQDNFPLQSNVGKNSRIQEAGKVDSWSILPIRFCSFPVGYDWELWPLDWKQRWDLASVCKEWRAFLPVQASRHCSSSKFLLSPWSALWALMVLLAMHLILSHSNHCLSFSLYL